MSRRFVAPSVESRSSTTSIHTVTSPIPVLKSDYLPPPAHPALARQRIPSPGPETYGALNRPPPLPPSHLSRTQSPAPPIPSRTPSKTLHSTNPGAETPISISYSSANPLSQLQTDTIYSSVPTIAQPEPRSGAHQTLISPDVSTPVLVVTPVPTPGIVDSDEVTLERTETLPPYSSEPNLASQTVPAAIERQPNTAISIPRPSNGHGALGLLNQGHLSAANLPKIAPPLHPSRQPSPSPLAEVSGLRHRAHSSTNIGSARTLDSNVPPRPSLSEDSRRGSGASVLTLKDSNLTDDDLRKMYDAEEVERYLRLFASVSNATLIYFIRSNREQRVNEVAIDPQHSGATATAPMPMLEEDGEWVPVSEPTWTHVRNVDPLPHHLANPQTPFQYIAALIYPYVIQPLPKGCETRRKFRLNRAASTAQRLYLAAYPAYVPALVYLGHLSTWRDPRRSAFWCVVFWAAWAGGFLSQVIVGRLLYALWTGGNVTREEIRRRRIAAREAEKLGRAIEGGIPGVSITGELGVWEVTKLVTGLGKKKAKKAKATAMELQRDSADQANGESNSDDSEDMEDWKLMLVDFADEVADLHERIKNIFLHRRPELTRFYIILLTLLFIGTFIVQDTSKIVTLVMGFWFWFIPPVVKQLPKLPSPFASAPTDAEVAMELISKRVERGERVVPERVSRRKKNKSVGEPGKLKIPTSSAPSRSTTDLTDTSTLVMSPSTASLLEGTSSDDEADVGLVIPQMSVPQEDRFRKGAVRAWNWWGKTKKRIDQTRGVESKTIHAHASADQSFPAQHRARPGMLMISSTLLTFTPLFTSSSNSQSQTPQDTRTVKVDIDHLRGVKKVTPSGLSVRYAQGSETVEEKFLFIVGRDEAFATLVGWGGGRWKHV
ncbi:hypothetical protein RSOLAG1IB_08905 [Rhizoctonia solani AG-1 IB]|uniref:Uncharacterized protein n=1 Tax=Thanatephorus cucumeris (strain AG1-IB / isolate 7/3/14) TaxID=1108050 RepID=A0A0B7FMF0_THACB|nr:hypothetical protein RSOLAG1IB_08905 [Rhizoctonia solani AG-1 IB]